MNTLSILAVSSAEENRKKLGSQLNSTGGVQAFVQDLEVSRAKKTIDSESPDIIVVDMQQQPEKAFRFVKEIYNMDPERPWVIFALVKKLDPDMMVDALHHGVKEFITYPDDPSLLETAIKKYRMLADRLRSGGVKKQKGKIFSVFAPKGGSGSTTVAFNLADAIRQVTSEPVVCFEPDQFYSNLMMLLNTQPEFCLSDLSKHKSQDIDEQILSKLVIKDASGIDFLVACKNVLDDNEMIPVGLMKQTLDYLVEQYTFVVVDLPSHTLDSYHQALVERSDLVLVVSGMDVPSLYRTIQYLRLAKTCLDKDKVKLILNKWDLDGAYGMSNKNMEKELPHPVYARLSDDWDLNLEANSLGVPLRQVSSNATLVKEIKRLAQNLLGFEDDQPAGKAAGGLFSKLAGLKNEAVTQ